MSSGLAFELKGQSVPENVASTRASETRWNVRQLSLLQTILFRLLPGLLITCAFIAMLDFGTRQQIFHGEFDRRRRKRVLVKTIGE